MTAEVSIRPARFEDLDVLADLLKSLFTIEADFQVDRERQLAGLKLLLHRPEARVLMAEVDDRVVGLGTAQLLVSTAEGGMTALIEDVVVAASHRGQGLGSRLLAGLAAWVESQGASRMQLLADRDNRPALSFYTKQGWTATRLVALRKYV